MNKIMKIYNKCEKLPFGKIIFSKLVCFKAPYFSSIKPQFIKLQQGYCEVLLPKRRAVTNHINSIHAIAMCNVSDLAAGTMLEASIPNTMRWIPKKMAVSFLKIAKTDLRAVCEMPLDKLDKPGELNMPVHVKDKNGEEVFRALITMHISLKK
jgi:acyl-coenzyme A thioesterase PaaI-like protein